jgi:hypothetical protein
MQPTSELCREKCGSKLKREPDQAIDTEGRKIHPVPAESKEFSRQRLVTLMQLLDRRLVEPPASCSIYATACSGSISTSLWKGYGLVAGISTDEAHSWQSGSFFIIDFCLQLLFVPAGECL